MPQNKLALQRYKILDKALSNYGRKWTLNNLIEEVNKVLFEKEGIEIHKCPPKNMEFAFLCVCHDQIIDFLKNYNGTVFNYRNIDFK